MKKQKLHLGDVALLLAEEGSSQQALPKRVERVMSLTLAPRERARRIGLRVIVRRKDAHAD